MASGMSEKQFHNLVDVLTTITQEVVDRKANDLEAVARHAAREEVNLIFNQELRQRIREAVEQKVHVLVSVTASDSSASQPNISSSAS